MLLEFDGYMDAANFDLSCEIFFELTRMGEHKIVVDVSKVQYISDISPFIPGIATFPREYGGNCVVLKPNPNVKEVMDLMGDSKHFDIADSLEEAISFF